MNISNSLFLKFSKSYVHTPDTWEKISNICLHPLRSALGYNFCQIDKEYNPCVKKTNNFALSCLWGLFAFTIGSPLILIGRYALSESWSHKFGCQRLVTLLAEPSPIYLEDTFFAALQDSYSDVKHKPLPSQVIPKEDLSMADVSGSAINPPSAASVKDQDTSKPIPQESQAALKVSTEHSEHTPSDTLPSSPFKINIHPPSPTAKTVKNDVDETASKEFIPSIAPDPDAMNAQTSSKPPLSPTKSGLKTPVTPSQTPKIPNTPNTPNNTPANTSTSSEHSPNPQNRIPTSPVTPILSPTPFNTPPATDAAGIPQTPFTPLSPFTPVTPNQASVSISTNNDDPSSSLQLNKTLLLLKSPQRSPKKSPKPSINPLLSSPLKPITRSQNDKVKSPNSIFKEADLISLKPTHTISLDTIQSIIDSFKTESGDFNSTLGLSPEDFNLMIFSMINSIDHKPLINLLKSFSNLKETFGALIQELPLTQNPISFETIIAMITETQDGFIRLNSLGLNLFSKMAYINNPDPANRKLMMINDLINFKCLKWPLGVWREEDRQNKAMTAQLINSLGVKDLDLKNLITEHPFEDLENFLPQIACSSALAVLKDNSFTVEQKYQKIIYIYKLICSLQNSGSAMETEGAEIYGQPFIEELVALCEPEDISTLLFIPEQIRDSTYCKMTYVLLACFQNGDKWPNKIKAVCQQLKPILNAPKGQIVFSTSCMTISSKITLKMVLESIPKDISTEMHRELIKTLTTEKITTMENGQPVVSSFGVSLKPHEIAEVLKELPDLQK